jgi:hypothetical protein
MTVSRGLSGSALWAVADGRADRPGRLTGARQDAAAHGRSLITVYLVDTNVISASVPSRLTAVRARHKDACALSLAVPFGGDGGGDQDRHSQVAARGATRKSEDLAAWFETVLQGT